MSRCALLAALIAIPAAARADQGVAPDRVPAKAKQLADRGRAFHDARDYARAIAAFQEAYALAPSPGLLFDLAQDYRLAGDCDEAAWMYRRYLDTNPSEDHRAIAEAHLQRVERCGHGTLSLAIPADRVESHIHTPRLPAALHRDLPAAGAPGDREQQLGLALAACGGVLLAGAAYFAYDSFDASNTVSSVYHHGGDGAGLAPVDARGQRSETYAEWLGVGGALAAASGITVYLLGRRAEHAHHLVLVPTAHGAAVHASWRF